MEQIELPQKTTINPTPEFLSENLSHLTMSMGDQNIESRDQERGDNKTKNHDNRWSEEWIKDKPLPEKATNSLSIENQTQNWSRENQGGARKKLYGDNPEEKDTQNWNRQGAQNWNRQGAPARDSQKTDENTIKWVKIFSILEEEIEYLKNQELNYCNLFQLEIGRAHV